MQNKKIITIFEGAVAWIFVVIIIGILGSWYLFQILEKEELSLETAKNDYQVSLRQLESFDKIKQDFESTKNIKAEAENMLVNADNTLSLIEELERAANVSGVSLKTAVGQKPGTTKIPISQLGQFPGKGASNKNTNEAPEPEVWLELTAEGNFEGILKFIRYLENSRKLIAVSSLNVNQATNISATDILENSEGELGYLRAVILVTNTF